MHSQNQLHSLPSSNQRPASQRGLTWAPSLPAPSIHQGASTVSLPPVASAPTQPVFRLPPSAEHPTASLSSSRGLTTSQSPNQCLVSLPAPSIPQPLPHPPLASTFSGSQHLPSLPAPSNPQPLSPARGLSTKPVSRLLPSAEQPTASFRAVPSLRVPPGWVAGFEVVGDVWQLWRWWWCSCKSCPPCLLLFRRVSERHRPTDDRKRST